ncbi:MAG: hypothetical protein J6S49_07560 [Erysipelotrichaceae bacterium]|nr:hypothetical protein [Erysipelotrichaceae bacterium]
MKRIFKIALFTVLTLMLVACSGGGSNGGNGGGGKKTIANDDVMALHLTVPEGFDSVERYSEADVDGKIIEKDLVFNYGAEEAVTIGFMPGQHLAEMTNVENLEQYEINGFTVYRFNSGSDVMGFIQNGDDLYVVDMSMKEPDDGSKLKELMGSVSFTNATTTIMDEASYEEVNYQLDEDHKVYSTSVRVIEDPEGNLLEKNVVWHYGTSEKEDFSFSIRVYKNKKYEDVLDENSTYEDVEINGITYKAYVSSANDPYYSFTTEQNGDVYNVRNNGDTSGWFASRSAESYECFNKFINSISYK